MSRQRVMGPGAAGARAAVTFLAALALLAVAPAPAGAGGNGGGAGATGKGDTIVSSIIDTSNAGSSRGKGHSGSRCVWVTLSDTQVTWLIHYLAGHPEITSGPLVDALAAWSAADGQATYDLSVRACDGVADPTTLTFHQKLVPITDAGPAATSQLRTLLPPPDLVITPLTGAVVGEPVFVSLRTDAGPGSPGYSLNASQMGTIGGQPVKIDIRATPTILEVFEGDVGDASTIDSCPAPGRAYDPSSELGPRRQARLPETCAMVFTHRTGGPGRRTEWTGYAQLDWKAEYSINGGPWQEILGLFSLRPISTTVREVNTAIERQP